MWRVDAGRFARDNRQQQRNGWYTVYLVVKEMLNQETAFSEEFATDLFCGYLVHNGKMGFKIANEAKELLYDRIFKMFCFYRRYHFGSFFTTVH